ncbi:hypothetical protein KP509_01G015800 [Ceratopteris richardii]|uniref:Uncharacterized protein n=1 Tax=Ceratopteris richardii TaxID=49495 RepID=A0A8T2VDZ8_CERRI|nr:hypothetical protein KP509_01G015800 [Ceratopteris richardii]
MSAAQAVLLGFQHYFVMLGTTVLIPTILVPQMGGDNDAKVKVIQTLLFTAGINTLLQSSVGTCLPCVVGGSYAYIIPTLSIIYSNRLQAIEDNHERFIRTMRAIQGALIASSSLQVVLGFSGLWGIFTRFLSPLVAAPLITMVGLGLYELGFPGVGKCVEIGIPQILLLVLFSQFMKNIRFVKPIFERFSVLLAVAIVWGYAHLLTITGAYKHSPELTASHCRTNHAALVKSSPWLRVPYPLQWGNPTFEASHVFGMLSAVLVSAVESTGGFLAASRFSGATPPPPFVMSRGLGWQGIGILFDGLFGTANGSTISVENVGLLGLSRVGSRRVVQIAAGFMIFFSLFAKFGAVFASVPLPIVAALFCVLFAKVVACGLSFLQFVNVNHSRSVFILGFSIFMGLSVPRYFNEFTASAGHGPVHTHSHWFNDIFMVIFTSAAMVAFVIGMLLDNTLQVSNSKKDRGMTWWAKFRSWKGDSRNEEFYSLPFNMNKYFPQGA